MVTQFFKVRDNSYFVNTKKIGDETKKLWRMLFICFAFIKQRFVLSSCCLTLVFF